VGADENRDRGRVDPLPSYHRRLGLLKSGGPPNDPETRKRDQHHDAARGCGEIKMRLSVEPPVADEEKRVEKGREEKQEPDMPKGLGQALGLKRRFTRGVEKLAAKRCQIG
jgi:hypothetical protein